MLLSLVYFVKVIHLREVIENLETIFCYCETGGLCTLIQNR